MSRTTQNNPAEHWLKSRNICKRIVIRATLELLTPANFGNGEEAGVADIALLRDPLTGCALLSGTTLAGALRNYLWEVEQGYGVSFNKAAHNASFSVQLFGSNKGDPDSQQSNQSALIIDDALGDYPQTELRDGVAIDPNRRTAEDDKKFDLELLRAGTTFPLCFELLIPSENPQIKPETKPETKSATNEATLRAALAIALSGLQTPGQLFLGVRKRRGFGECLVKSWSVTEYDLTTQTGLLDWLSQQGSPKQGGDIIELLLSDAESKASYKKVADQRVWFHCQAAFGLESSLLIRSGTGEIDAGPDAMHLHRIDVNGIRTPVLPGTSLAGVMRSRALRIAQTLHKQTGKRLVAKLFGDGPESAGVDRSDDEIYVGSRIQVRESLIQKGHTLVQNRIRIDRFSGGVLDTYLFDEAPLFATPDTLLAVDCAIRAPQEHEIGLLLLILKDLWSADLPVGGGSNIGRGRLFGRKARLTYHQPGQTRIWEIEPDPAQPSRLLIKDATNHPVEAQSLETFVKALNHWQEGG